MNNKPKEQPQIAVKFANMVFMLGILFPILLIVFAIYKIYNPPGPVSSGFYIIIMLFGAVFAALFGLGLKKLSNDLKVKLSLLFFTTGIAVYGCETYLEFQLNILHDTRTQMEVLDDLRDSGVEAYPNLNPEQHLTDNDVIHNFGGISNITTIFDNEAGYYPIIEMDEHGFNNPKGLYIENKVDIVLIGDSFAEGYSVHSNETISAVLRQLEFNVISFGKGSSGPLIELATLKEYAEPLKPKIVLWLYYVNDFINLEVEMKSSILKKYLNEDNYSQNLILRQEEIDDVLINYVQTEWEKERKRVKIRIINILKLTKLRWMINLKPKLASTPTPIFRDILQKSKQIVSEWDGKMYFVYLPGFERYSTGSEHANRDFVMQTAIEMDIPIIDIHREVFDLHPDPLSLFPIRMSFYRAFHYNAEGYRLVAKAIGERLLTDGYAPIRSKK